MTYKQNRKIKFYILIIIIIFILLNNFQLIFNTRNIFKNNLEDGETLIFLEKELKTEEEPNERRVLQGLKGVLGSISTVFINYKQENRTISTSRSRGPIDNDFLLKKGLIDSGFKLYHLLMSSVKNWVFDFKKMILSFQSFFIWLLEEEVFPRGRPLAKGMLLGDTSGVSQELYQSFKVIGILHLLSASSSNLTLFLRFFKPIFMIFTHFFQRKKMFFFYVAVIFTYFSLVGVAASMLRAVFIMFLAYLAKFYLKRAYLPLYLLIVVAIFVLLINPFYLSSLGFQLSFLASFGIYYLFPKLKKSKNGPIAFLQNNLLITVAAQFFLLIVFVSTFGELNYIGILANLLVSPLVEGLTTGFLLLVFIAFLAKYIAFFRLLMLFKHFLSHLLFEILNIFEEILLFLNKIPYKEVRVEENKDLYIGVIIFINLLVVLYFELTKKRSHKKEKYRILK